MARCETRGKETKGRKEKKGVGKRRKGMNWKENEENER